MLTARKLFTGENEISILEQVREARVEPPSKFNDEVSPEIDRIVLKSLDKEPANRYQTAAEMARDIDSVLYAMRPTPTSADLAIYMHRVHAAAPVAVAPEPVVEPPVIAPPPKPVAVTPPPTPPGVMMPSWESRTQQQKRPPVALIAAAAAVIIAAISGFLWWRGRSASPKPAAVVARAAAPVAAPPPTNTVPPPAATETVAAATIAPSTTQPPVLDTAKINEEVQKRLVAERAKLEEQMRRPQPAAAQPSTPILQRITPQPQPQPVFQPPPATQTQAPAPQPAVVGNSQPAPVTQTVVQPPSPPPAPAPQPAQAETAPAREGELVASGSEDVPAKMTQRANVPYPPMARLQRVQGTVLVSALISETGRVLDVKLIRPINRPVGLNEAALQIVRQSTFTPPMKDGVRVKSWTTVPVDFKL
jgi:TonB family protein